MSVPADFGFVTHRIPYMVKLCFTQTRHKQSNDNLPTVAYCYVVQILGWGGGICSELHVGRKLSLDA